MFYFHSVAGGNVDFVISKHLKGHSAPHVGHVTFLLKGHSGQPVSNVTVLDRRDIPGNLSVM